ncbi:MAG TPA: META domain-containing protein [Candidatus Limnocylindria bacterium]|jgi:heat shock protein HslJ
MSDPAGLAPFDGIAWRATRFGSLLAHEPTAGQEFSLEVQGDRLAGRSGCNRFMGTWSVTDGALAIGPMASTMMWCDGLMELERAFLDAVQSVTGARLDGDHLVLLAGGEPVVELAQAEEQPEP